jgi:hypothetical protein
MRRCLRLTGTTIATGEHRWNCGCWGSPIRAALAARPGAWTCRPAGGGGPEHSLVWRQADAWMLRKTKFRQYGAPHTLLLLNDVSVPLKEEEQAAWKRLVRVLGHELSNSLAPIKSIAGSLLARVDRMGGDEAELHDFRRGLGVVESRADRCIGSCSPTACWRSCRRRTARRFNLGRCWNGLCCSSSAFRLSWMRDRRWS